MDVQSCIAGWVGETLGMPCEYGEFPPAQLPAAMVKVSPGDPVVRRYRAGGGVFRVPYEVYVKVAAATQDGRIGGLEALRGLSSRIQAGEVPDGGARWAAHRVTNAPSLYAETGGTVSVYQLTAELTYIDTTPRR